MVFIVFLFIIGFVWIIQKFILNPHEEIIEYRENNPEQKKYKSPEEIEKSLKIKREKADIFINKVKEIIYDNRYTLSSERNRLIKKDAYGNINYDNWFRLHENIREVEVNIAASIGGNKQWADGLPYFFLNVLLPNLYGSNSHNNAPKFFKDYRNYCKIYPDVIDATGSKTIERTRIKSDWFTEIANIVEEVCNELANDNTNIEVKMTGIEYEQYCKRILQDAGWEVEDTTATGDQGVDLIASIENIRVCIQCKCFKKAVGNKAVQEIVAGKTYWSGSHAVVVAKSGFTKSAKKLADSTNVILISDVELAELENMVL